MKNSIKAVDVDRKQRTIEVLFNDPMVSAALARVNVFAIDHYPNGRRVSTSLISAEDFAAQPSYDPLMWLNYVHPEDRERVRSAWETIVHGEKDVFEAEYRFLVGEEYRWIANKGTIVYRTESGQPELYLGADRDITEERRLRQLLEEEREHLAQLVISDDFLSIPNRRYLETKQAQFFCTNGRTPVAVLVLDIDNFKQLNTHLTHHGGDAALQSVVRKIQTCLRDTDILARYGGDEFVLIFPQATAEYAQVTAQGILDAVQGIDLPKVSDMSISVSIGLVHGCPTEGQDFWSYFEDADSLLLQAKKFGKAQVQSKVFC
ncbi:GGDEF domain-containing protein [Marinomonas transparens]|uniref:diguanylate cyclase n=1 Tax=Marinomonas transparens TaxID=2795388 RepID=A0A934N4Q8_9GAMM|nr:sensor domain-containing diguanylate cyclase [Marinomonas transparens]MBJ7536261.1 sensor domain-containing diguanylate cyclase [Marinomonas transparens]